MAALGSGHARGDRGQHQNAFESFAEDENSDVEKRDCRAGVRPRWVRRAMRRDSLPDQHRNDEKGSYNDADAQSGLHCLETYHIHALTAGGGLLFFSGSLRREVRHLA